MTLADLDHLLGSWAPGVLAWERDSVGIQVGAREQRIRTILVALDVTDDVIKEAVRKRADVIVSHHPLFFHPLKRLSTDDRIGRMVTDLTRQKIAVYAAHTNLDAARNGVSAALARALGLAEVAVLRGSERLYRKIVVFVPANFAEAVKTAMAAAGAGAIGNYDRCSFGSEGTGTFRAQRGAMPYVGTVGRVEQVKEVRVEMLAPSWLLGPVLAAMRSAHPYEEVAHDVYTLENRSSEYGTGAVGELPRAMRAKKFLGQVKRRLHGASLRYGGSLSRTIRRVAVCGGSGADLLTDAIAAGADAFVTADLSYHRFEEADGRILLVDAGHYETEHPVLRSLVEFLTAESAKRVRGIHVSASTAARNPVQSYI